MLISDTSRKALVEKVPDTDFAPYFAFVESLPTSKHGNKHRILPKKEFPEYAKNFDNIIRVSPADHFRAHYWLAVCAPQCESFQRVFFFMTKFRKYASQVSVDELPLYAEVYERGGAHQAEVSSFYGLENKKNGTGICALGAAARGGRKGGPIVGRKMSKADGPKSWETKRLRVGKFTVFVQRNLVQRAEGSVGAKTSRVDIWRRSLHWLGVRRLRVDVWRSCGH